MDGVKLHGADFGLDELLAFDEDDLTLEGELG
jgi:hypothetical protein